MQGLFRDFSRLYRFSSLEQRRFMDGYFIRYEISCLKMIIRSIMTQGERPMDIGEYLEVFERHSQIPLSQAASADSMESLIAALAGTPYRKVLSDVYGSSSRELFDYELALDVFFFDRFWKMVKKDLKEDDQEAIARSVGAYIDALNLTWIYRAKKYYRMSAAQIYALIVPIHYRLTREQVRQMAEAADEKEFLTAAENTKRNRCRSAVWRRRRTTERYGYSGKDGAIHLSTGRRGMKQSRSIVSFILDHSKKQYVGSVRSGLPKFPFAHTLQT